MIEILRPDFVFEDGRGALTQLVHGGYSQVNVIRSNAGSFRGGHYHKQNQEAFYIIYGEVELAVSGTAADEIHRFYAGDMFSISPGTMHSFRFLTDTLLVSMYDKGVELPDGTKDIFSL